MITAPPDSRMLAVFKASLPRQLKGTERRRIISVIGIAAIVAKQLKSTVFVYAGMCYEVISVYVTASPPN